MLGLSFVQSRVKEGRADLGEVKAIDRSTTKKVKKLILYISEIMRI